MIHRVRRRFFFFTGLLLSALLAGCASEGRNRMMVVTAYCGCGECNGYTRGHWYFLKLDFWDRVIASGPHAGEPYTGRTASGDRLRVYHPGLFSLDSLTSPWMIPPRMVLPWLWQAQDGTLAADTDYYPFGTRMYVPGYGWGRVEDRGVLIRGEERLDLFMRRHSQTEAWGRQHVMVTILPPP